MNIHLPYSYLKELTLSDGALDHLGPSKVVMLLPEFGATITGVCYTGYGFGMIVDKEVTDGAES